MNRSTLKSELKDFLGALRSLDKKVITVFLSVAILQTFSWYFTSRYFFRLNIYPHYQFDPDVYLYEYLYWFTGDFFSFFVLPVLIVKLLFREKLRNFGLTFGEPGIGIKISLIFLLIMIPLVWIFSSLPDFVRTYPQLAYARDNWNTFFIFEAGVVVYVFAWEFIWRGFMLFGLKEKFGYYAIFIQMIPFVILHNGKPAAETFGAIVAGIALGVLAWRTRSVYYCLITHAGVMFGIDLMTTLRYRAGDYGIGISSMLNVLKQIF